MVKAELVFLSRVFGSVFVYIDVVNAIARVDLARIFQSTPLRTAQTQKHDGLMVALGDTFELVL